MKELKYRIIKDTNGEGMPIYLPQVKYSFWPFWVSCSKGYWRDKEEKAKHDIAIDRKRRRKQQITYEGNGKDLEFIEDL